VPLVGHERDVRLGVSGPRGGVGFGWSGGGGRRARSIRLRLVGGVVVGLVRLGVGREGWGPRRLRVGLGGNGWCSRGATARVWRWWPCWRVGWAGEWVGAAVDVGRALPVERLSVGERPNGVWTAVLRGWWWIMGGRRCEGLIRGFYIR